MLRKSYFAVELCKTVVQTIQELNCFIHMNKSDCVWVRYWAIYLHFAGREAASPATTWDAQVGVDPEHPNLTYVLCERRGKDVQWMHNFYSVPNSYPCFTPFFLLLWLKKKIYMVVFFSLPFPLHPLSSTCAEALHESTNQTHRLSLWVLPAYLELPTTGHWVKDFFPHSRVYHSDKLSKNTYVFTL